MSILLKYTDVDTGIQVEMAGQAPDENKRLYAINTELKTLRTKYDIVLARRRVIIKLIPNTTGYPISDDITDIQKIVSLKYNDPSTHEPEFVDSSEDDVDRRLDAGLRRNEFSQYWENGGKLYLKVNTISNETALTDFEIVYLTTNLAQDSGGSYQEEVTAGADVKILLPERYRDLVVLGACKRLFYPAMGDDSERRLAIIRNRYTSELDKLGLDRTGVKPKKEIRKLKLRPWL